MGHEKIISQALAYQKMGFSVIPVGKDKIPLIEWKPYQEKKVAEAEIIDWFNKFPEANVGIVTGSISGIVVVDVEAGGDVANLPPTVIAKTGGGGWHYYYKHPGQPIKNAVRICDRTDVRGDKGFVVAPPSVHQSGNLYEWAVSPADADFNDLPEWVAEKLSDSGEPTDWKKIITSNTAQGARNMTAAQLAGKLLYHLPPDMWELTGWSGLKAWNSGQLNPPLSEKELRSVWESIKGMETKSRAKESLLGKSLMGGIGADSVIRLDDAGKARNGDAAMDLSCIPDGTFLKNLLDLYDGVTDAPDEFLMTGGLLAVSTVMKGEVWCRYGSQLLRPHLWAIILAPSSRLRKTTVINQARSMVSSVSPELVFSDENTPESFIEYLAETPFGLFPFTEIGGVLKQMERSYMGGFKEFLTDIYDSPETYTRRRKEKGKPVTFEIKKPTINILAGSTMDWFLKNSHEGDIASGFLPRFLFSYRSRRTKSVILLPKKIDEGKRQLLAGDLTMIANEWIGEKRMSPEAESAYMLWAAEVERRMDKENRPELDAFYTRMTATVIKIAMAVEATLQVRNFYAGGMKSLENSNLISKEAMASAIGLANYYLRVCRQLVMEEFVFTRYEYDAKKIKQILLKNNGSMTKRELSRASKYSKEMLDKILATLEESGDIAMTEKRTTSGQGSEEIRII